MLADYFDYIAGTSTGAIIATGLSLGMRVEQIRDFYLEAAPSASSSQLGSGADSERDTVHEWLSTMLQQQIVRGDHARHERLRTLLMLSCGMPRPTRRGRFRTIPMRSYNLR